MNPFEVLGLVGTVPDRAAVRRAYAAKVREHRPEEDPAGFRLVRDAYEFLSSLDEATLAALAQGRAPGTPPDAVPAVGEVPAPEAAPAPAPESSAVPGEPAAAGGVVVGADWIALFDRARDLPEGPERDRAVAQAFVQVTAAAATAPDRLPEYEALVRTSLGARPDLLRGGVPAPLLVEALRRGLWAVPHAVMGARDEAKDWLLILDLALAVEAAAPPVEAPESAGSLAYLANLTALHDPRTARALADRAHRLATPAVRSRIPFPWIDGLARAGDEVKNLSAETKATLAGIAHADFDPVRETATAGRLVNDLAALPNQPAATVQLLAGRAPALHERLMKRVRGRVTRAVRTEKARKRGIPWVIVMVLILGANVSKLFTKPSHQPDYSWKTPDITSFDSKPIFDEETRRLLQDYPSTEEDLASLKAEAPRPGETPEERRRRIELAEQMLRGFKAFRPTPAGPPRGR